MELDVDVVPKPARTSALSAQGRRGSATRGPPSTASFPASCAREATLPAATAQAASPSTAKSSPTRISSRSTSDPACSPWPMPAPTRTEASSSSARPKRPGWTVNTLSSDASPPEWTSLRRSRRWEARKAKPARRSSSPNPAFFEHSELCCCIRIFLLLHSRIDRKRAEENIFPNSICGVRRAIYPRYVASGAAHRDAHGCNRVYVRSFVRLFFWDFFFEHR